MSDTITWISPKTSTDLDLSNRVDFLALEGIEDLFLPPRNLIRQQTIGLPGAIYQDTEILERTITIPLLTRGFSRQAWAETSANLGDLLTEDNNNGTLKFEIGTTTRIIRVRLSANSRNAIRSFREDAQELQFMAIDNPFFEAETSSQVSFIQNEDTSDWFDPFLFNLGVSGSYSTTVINNPGTAEADPTFIVTGACDNVLLLKNSPLSEAGTIEQISFIRALAEGETLTINSGIQVLFKNQVVSSINGNLYNDLSDSDMFQLSPGDNSIQLFAVNPSDNFSCIVVFTPNYKGPYG